MELETALLVHTTPSPPPSLANIDLPLPLDTDFSLANIPFGVFTPPPSPLYVTVTKANVDSQVDVLPIPKRHICTAIGEYILDLHILALNNAFYTIVPGTGCNHPLLQPTLNSLAALGNQTSRAIRTWIRKLVEAGGLPTGTEPDSPRAWPAHAIWKMDTHGIQMHLPFDIGDFTAFYASRYHAANEGHVFRGMADGLHRNYLHLPVAHQGRASSVVISGTPIVRPHGQVPRAAKKPPKFGPTEKLDFEIELAAFVGKPSTIGHPVHVDKAMEHIFGFVLLNDWSARDIEGWECIPLGPFNGKNFATTVSPWVITPDVIEPYLIDREPQLSSEVQIKRTESPESGQTGTDKDGMVQVETAVRGPIPLLPYLNESNNRSIYHFRLECHINPPQNNLGKPDWSSPAVITSPRYLIWSFPQMVAQHTVSGCALRTGDLISSGGISGPLKREMGTLLERNGGATGRKVSVGWGKFRVWLENGDEVIIRAWRPIRTVETTAETTARDLLHSQRGEVTQGLSALLADGAEDTDELRDYFENEVKIVTDHMVSEDAKSEWEHNQAGGDVTDHDVRGILDRAPGIEKKLHPELEKLAVAMGKTTQRSRSSSSTSRSPTPQVRHPRLVRATTSLTKSSGMLPLGLDGQEGQEEQAQQVFEINFPQEQPRGRSLLRSPAMGIPSFPSSLTSAVASLASVPVRDRSKPGNSRGISSPGKRRSRSSSRPSNSRIQKKRSILHHPPMEERVGFGECIGVIAPAINWRREMVMELEYPRTDETTELLGGLLI